MNPLKDPSEELIHELFTEHLREELRDPQIRTAKQELIRRHFQPPLIPILGWEILAPACAVFLFFLLFQRLQAPPPSPAKPIQQLQQTPFMQEQGVQVKSVSSHVGSTLVFQRKRPGMDTSVTVIWVFKGGNP